MSARWRFSWAWFLGAVLILGPWGCGPINIPAPIPTPEPPPAPSPPPTPTPSPICVEGQTYGCYHNPGEGWLYACPVYDASGGVVGVQNVADPSTCPAKPEPPIVEPGPPTPAPPPTSDPPCMEEAPLVEAACSGEEYSAEVSRATAKLGRLGPDCRANLKALAAELQARTGRCSIGGIEAVFIVRPDMLVEENHACFFKDGSWTGAGRGRFKGCHSIGASQPPPPVTPSPAPPETGACSSPQPPKVGKWGGPKAHHGASGKTNDSTPQFYNGAAFTWAGTPIVGYCNAIGFSDRLFCPARMECKGEGEPGPQNFKCAERPPCEELGVSGRYGGKPLWRSDGTVNLTDNPFQATCSSCTWLEVCAADGTLCGRCAIDASTGLCAAS